MAKRPKRPNDYDALVMLGIIKGQSMQTIADEIGKSANAINQRIRYLDGTQGTQFVDYPLLSKPKKDQKGKANNRKVTRLGIDWLLENGYVTKEQLIYQEVP